MTQPASDTAISDTARFRTAIFYGALCHGLFAIAALTMVLVMGSGMTWGQGTLTGWVAWLANLALLLQLPLGHSALLTGPGRRLLAWLAPGTLGRDLAPTTYVIVASVQVFALFYLWSPSGTIWWQAEGLVLGIWLVIYVLPWGLLGLSTVNSGLGLQSGTIGWWAVLKRRRPRYPDLPTQGLFRLTRNPIYVSFALTTWAVPIWTPDQLLVAVVLTSYCVFGPRLKEARQLRYDQGRFARYREAVPYWLPAVWNWREALTPAAPDRDLQPHALAPEPIAVVIPTLNEADSIADRLRGLQAQGFAETIVCDGGSTDGTAAIARAAPGVIVVTSEPGRGVQLAAGLSVASAPIVLLLHADTELPPDAPASIRAALSDRTVSGGSFQVRFDRTDPWLVVYAWFSRFDSVFTTFGDQAYFMRREMLGEVGGVPPWPLFEDVELRRRLRTAGRFVKCTTPVTTSARRFTAGGPLRVQLRNLGLLLAYLTGGDPERLARRYRADAKTRLS